MVVFDMYYTNDVQIDANTVACEIGEHLREELKDASSTK